MNIENPKTVKPTGVFQRLLNWVGGHERQTLVLLLLAAAALWGFVGIAGEVLEGDTVSIDQRLLLSLRSPADPSDPIGAPWIEEMARDFTGLGGTGVLTFLTLASALFLFLQGKTKMAIYLLSAICTGMIVTMLLKAGFDRPRPDLVAHGSYVYTSSFPSGHSMMSAIVFLTLGALLASMQSSLGIKAYLLGIAAFLTLMVGLSRVYLGVHWPTDVLAGWTGGAAWALLCWALAQWLRKRGQVE